MMPELAAKSPRALELIHSDVQHQASGWRSQPATRGVRCRV